MPDPARSFRERRSDPDGVGPYQFRVGTDFGSGGLASGEKAVLDLREYSENGTVGYYVVLSESGYDTLQVENRDTDNPVTITVNENAEMGVPANTIQTLTQRGMYRFAVTNDGSTTIPSGDVVVEIQASPFGADDAARQRLFQSPVQSVVKNFTGIGL